jgi:hypothetical protein
VSDPAPAPGEGRPGRWSRRFQLLKDHRAVLPLPLMPIFVGALADATYGWHVPHDFMQISAQVLPVLILALALETKVMSIRDLDDPTLRDTGIGVALLLAIGELAAILALLINRDPVILAAPAIFALGFALALILMFAVLDPAAARSRRASTLTAQAAERVRQHAKHSD